MNKTTFEIPEIWGGIECTINRLDDHYLDQLGLAGIYDNPCYLNAIVDLGIKKLRFPILREKHIPCSSGKIDWSWSSPFKT